MSPGHNTQVSHWPPYTVRDDHYFCDVGTLHPIETTPPPFHHIHIVSDVLCCLGGYLCVLGGHAKRMVSK